MRYTYLGLALLAFALILYVEAFLFENLIPAFCGLGIIAYIAYDRLSYSHQLKRQNLEVKREVMEKMLFSDKPFTVLTRIRNLGGPVRIQFEDLLPPGLELRSGSNKIDTDLNSGEVAKLKFTVQASKRGFYVFETISMTSKDRAGFFESDVRLTHLTGVRVHSSREELRKAQTIAKREHLEMLGRSPERWSRTREFEFEGIREYEPGDRFRDIHWKAVSRFQELMTKVFERETMVPTTIMVDCGRSMRLTTDGDSKLDHAVKLSIQLARILLKGYHPTGVTAFDELGPVTEVKPDVTKGQYDKLLRALLNVPEEIRTERKTQPRMQATANEEGGEKLVQVVSSYISGTHKMPRSPGVGAESVVKNAIAKGGRGKMFIIISDLESNQESVERAAKLARAHGHRVILASPESTWYGTRRRSLTVDEVEKMYESYMAKAKILGRLSRLGVTVLELGPKDEATSVSSHIRRMAA